MSRSRQRQNSEDVCYACGQLRKLAKLRQSKGSNGEDTLICKDRKACGKEERVIIKALVRRIVKDTTGTVTSDRQLQWIFKEIGNDQIEMTGALLPTNSPTLQDIKNLIDNRHLSFSEGVNKVSVLCLNFTRETALVVPESVVESLAIKPFLTLVK